MIVVYAILFWTGYALVAWKAFPALNRLEFDKGPDADLRRLATRGQTYGSFGTMKGPAAFNTVLLLVLLPGYLAAKLIAAIVSGVANRESQKPTKPYAAESTTAKTRDEHGRRAPYLMSDSQVEEEIRSLEGATDTDSIARKRALEENLRARMRSRR